MIDSHYKIAKETLSQEKLYRIPVKRRINIIFKSKNFLLFNLDTCMNTPSVQSLSPYMQYNLLE